MRTRIILVQIHVRIFVTRGLDGRECFFKVDTGSDVSFINSRLVSEGKEKLKEGGCDLRYRTREKVSFEGRILVKVQIGKF